MCICVCVQCVYATVNHEIHQPLINVMVTFGYNIIHLCTIIIRIKYKSTLANYIYREHTQFLCLSWFYITTYITPSSSMFCCVGHHTYHRYLQLILNSEFINRLICKHSIFEYSIFHVDIVFHCFVSKYKNRS